MCGGRPSGLPGASGGSWEDGTLTRKLQEGMCVSLLEWPEGVLYGEMGGREGGREGGKL